MDEKVFFLPLPLPRYFSSQLNSHSLDVFSSLPKPLPSLNPRWPSLQQNALARDLARQDTPALQAKKEEIEGYSARTVIFRLRYCPLQAQ